VPPASLPSGLVWWWAASLAAGANAEGSRCPLARAHRIGRKQPTRHSGSKYRQPNRIYKNQTNFIETEKLDSLFDTLFSENKFTEVYSVLYLSKLKYQTSTKFV
jgi:hypothetical protein